MRDFVRVYAERVYDIHTGAGSGARLTMLVHHDDAEGRFAYGLNSRVGTFPDTLMGGGEAAWLEVIKHEERLEAYLRLRG